MLTFRRALATGAMLMVFVTLSACSKPSDEVDVSKLKSGARAADATFSIKVGGAYQFDFEDDTILAINALVGESVPKDLWFFSVGSGPVAWVTEDRDLGFRFALDLVKQYKGDGKYTIKPNVRPSGQRTTLASDGVLEITLPREGIQRRYDRVLVDCAMEIKKDGTQGSLSCPRLADDQGSEISMRVKWFPKPKQTQSPTQQTPTQTQTTQG